MKFTYISGGIPSSPGSFSLPSNEAAPSASVIFRPLSCSPNFNVIQFLAPSTVWFGVAELGTASDDRIGGKVIDCAYQYLAKNDGVRLYCPGGRLRKANSPALSGELDRVKT